MALSTRGTSLKGTFDKFNGSNDISVWRYSMESLFRAIGVHDYAENKVPQPSYWSEADVILRIGDIENEPDTKEYRTKKDTIEAENFRRLRMYQNWRSQDSKAIVAIQDNCEPQILTKFNLSKTSHAIWIELISKYKGKGWNTKWDIFRKIEQTKLKDYDSIATYGQQIVKYVEEVKLMKISWDEHASIKFLNGLGDRYDGFLTALRLSAGDNSRPVY
jgi:gag-polypeptide of LTR copia-type